MVAIDNQMRPIPIPQFAPETEEERQEHANAIEFETMLGRNPFNFLTLASPRLKSYLGPLFL